MRAILFLFALFLARNAIAYSDLVPSLVEFPSLTVGSSYVITAPAKIRPNMDLSVSVQIIRALGDVEVSVALTNPYSPMEIGTVGSGVFSSGETGSILLKVPSSLTSSVYSLQVEGTGGLSFSKTAILYVNNKILSLFIQTDKAIYKPGDTVYIRVFGMYPDLQLNTGLMNINITDGEGNTISQWSNVQSKDGVVSQELPLSLQPVLGDWTIRVETVVINRQQLQRRSIWEDNWENRVETKKISEEKEFTVAEYVLPKMDVSVLMPPYVITSDRDVTFTVKAKYTFGESVKGIAIATLYILSEPGNIDKSNSLEVITLETPVDSNIGDTKFTVTMSSIRSIQSDLDGKSLYVETKVNDTATGITAEATGEAELYDKGVTIEFLSSSNQNIKPGLDYTAYFKLSQPDGRPLTVQNAKVKITALVKTRTAGEINQNIPDQPIPASGIVPVQVDIPSNTLQLSLKAEYDGATASKTISSQRSESGAFIQIRLTTVSTVQAGQDITFSVTATEPLGTVTYQIYSRGYMITVGTVEGKNKQEIEFTIVAEASMAPNARMVVYYVNADGEIVADVIGFTVDGVFRNKVSISASKDKAEPNETINWTVRADPSSTAYLLALDQSLLNLESGNDVTAEDVHSELNSYDSEASSTSNYYDSKEVFKNAGVVVLSDASKFQDDAYIKKNTAPSLPRLPLTRIDLPSGPSPIVFALYRLADKPPPVEEELEVEDQLPVPLLPPFLRQTLPPLTRSIDPPLVKPKRVRSRFPETWLWTSALVGSNGTAVFSATVPDTLTTWVASVFAVNSVTGLGVAEKPYHLTVFRQFFVSLSLPYSVVRGEQLIVKAVVFNYLSTGQFVRVTLKHSDEYDIIQDGSGGDEFMDVDGVAESVVYGNANILVKFAIVPRVVGKIDITVWAQSFIAGDAVRRQLLVEAEGTPKDFNIPIYVVLGDGDKSFTKTVNLDLPANTVLGSQLVKISVTGDVMWPSISGLDALLKLPVGCGEQNMLFMAPDVYVAEYLTAVNQFSGQVADKALGYMKSGYQRELTYKLTDGSFSAFGASDQNGSMWLTAFVARVFYEARAHIYVDDNVIRAALNWTIAKQNADGSFPEPGRVIHKSMQGNAGSGVALTLFVYITLRETDDLMQNYTDAESARAQALTYLENHVSQTNDLYVLALASYAFQLAGSPQTDTVLKRLNDRASIEDGLMFWQQLSTGSATTGSWHSPNTAKAVDIEMTSYVLLTYAARRDIQKGRSIMQWLVKQRNSRGGFVSTQDTVVALQALSEMAKLTTNDNLNMDIVVKLNASSSLNFHVDESNRFVLQTRETKTVPEQIEITATGTGLALVEISVFFSVGTEIEDTNFDLTVDVKEESLDKLTIKTCTSYLGDDPASGMAVQETGIPSGFEADLDSVTTLDILKRTEIANKKLVLYFDEISHSQVCVTFSAVRVHVVAKVKPVAVRVYDYYEPANQITVFYQPQSLYNVSVCALCKDCTNCKG